MNDVTSCRYLARRKFSTVINMNCVMEGNCVKAFGKAIHALSRIGDELWLDPTVKGMAVRSMNSSQSAYGCFLFSTLFFQSYRFGSGPTQATETVKCKLLMKSVLPLFRSLISIERNVDKCRISINTADGRVVFQFYCKHGIIKTHNLGYQESEALQAVFPSHLCPNMLKAQARLLVDMVLHFPATQEEITLSTNPMRVHLRNYYENGDDRTKIMHTEMSLDPSEFDCYQIGVDSDITFCLKELRGLLSFAESHGLPVSIHFGAAGKPLCFSVEDMVLGASVVLATLMDLESRSPSQATEAKAPAIPMDAALYTKATSRTPQRLPAVTELVASSQGSPMMYPTALVSQLTGPDMLQVPNKEPHRVINTPSCSMFRCLLFGALTTQDHEGCVSMVPVLACSSDTEDDDKAVEESP